MFLDDEDIDILAHKGVWLSTNPSSNYKLASGVFMLQKLLDKGCKIALGTDSMASNNNLSMLDEMKLCALSAKIQSQQPALRQMYLILPPATEQTPLELMPERLRKES